MLPLLLLGGVPGIAGASANAQVSPADEAYQRIVDAYQAKDWPRAVAATTAFTEEFAADSRLADAMFYKAKACSDSHQYGDAIAAFQRYLELTKSGEGKTTDSDTGGPTRCRAVYRLGEAAYRSNRPALARETLARYCRDFADSDLVPYAHTYLGDLALREQDCGLAVRHFDDAIRGIPDGPWRKICVERRSRCVLRLADSALAASQIQEVMGLVRKVDLSDLSVDVSIEYHRILGEAYGLARDFDRARFHLRQVMTQPTTPADAAGRAQLAIAETYFSSRRYREALGEFLRLEVLDVPPVAVAEGMVRAADCYELLERENSATETYVRIVSRFSHTPHAAVAMERLSQRR